jgi:type IV secretory pathway component VirB8
MQQNLDNKTQQEQELDEEYLELIKESFESGAYFKDSLDWYFLRYVNPIVDRSLMIMVSLIAAISLYFLFQIISHAFPLVEQVPIVIRDHDTSIYRPIIHELRAKNDESVKNVDEAVAKYLLTNYVKERESFDFRDSDVSEVNQKFNRVKNNSTLLEYRNFQAFMSRDNAESPVNFFGKNIYKTVKIQAVNFIRSASEDKMGKFTNFFSNEVPKKAEITFLVTTHKINEAGDEVSESQSFIAKIDFDFKGVNREAKSGVLRFIVNDYKLFKILT